MKSANWARATALALLVTIAPIARAELSAEELAKISQNPVGNLISVPFQLLGLRISYVVPRGSTPRSATQLDCARTAINGMNTMAVLRRARVMVPILLPGRRCARIWRRCGRLRSPASLHRDAPTCPGIVPIAVIGIAS